MVDRVQLSQLSREQLEAVVVQLEEERNVMTATNNGLLVRIADLPGVPAEIADLLNQWSTVCNQITTASEGEIRRIVYAVDQTVN